ncbi:MAG: thiamine phosphate synthase [Methylophilaceae bacterium]
MTSNIINGIYAITPDWEDTRQLIIKTEELLSNKINLLQYRNKKASKQLRMTQAKELQALCHHYQVPFIINDDYELCGILNADGIHLGKDDITIEEVRDRLGNNIIVGISCYNDFERVNEMMTTNCDYIALGACFPTNTKPNAPHASLNFLENVVEISIKPVVAIGGINLDNCLPIINSGVNAIAMINALYSTDKVSDKILEIKRKFIND